MSVENGEKAADEAAADAVFLRENVDIKYLKKTIDIGLVNSILEEFRPAPPTARAAEQPEPEPMMEIKEEKGILQRIKGLWGGTDKKLKESDANIENLESAHAKLKEIQQLKHQYNALLAEKLGKIVK